MSEFTLFILPPMLTIIAFDKAVMTGRSSVCDHISVLSVLVEDNAIGTGLAAIKNLKRLQDWVFVPGTRDREVKTLMVLILVRIVVFGLPVLQQGVSLGQRSVNVGLPVACTSAGFDTGLRLAGLQRSSVDVGEEEDVNGGNLCQRKSTLNLRKLLSVCCCCKEWGRNEP